jgi:GntR family uxuAB operon transcriptional repressor
MTATRRDDAEASVVADAVLQHAREAAAHKGTKLPTEREIGRDLGLSRHSLRRALALLEADGWISREVGRGTFLMRSTSDYDSGYLDAPQSRTKRQPDGGLEGGARATAVDQSGHPRRRGVGTTRNGDTAVSGGLADVGPVDVMNARHVVEPNAMGFVVARATPRDFETLHECIAGGDNATTFESFEFWDLALHRAIISASHNPLLIRLYESIEEARNSPIWGELKRGSSSSQRREAYCADHHAIVEALVLRDSGAASESMRGHLTRIETDLFSAAPISRAEARPGRRSK